MIWAFGPGPGVTLLSAYCRDTAEWDLVADQSARGVLRFDDQAATMQPEPESDRSILFARFLLDQPFRMPPLILTLEDLDAAARIGWLGWHSFHGYVHRATLIEPGRILLEHAYTEPPPPHYLGEAESRRRHD